MADEKEFTLPAPMTCAEALHVALVHLIRTGTLPSHRVAAEALLAILEQRGCEDFEAGATDGRLTTLMDIVIYG